MRRKADHKVLTTLASTALVLMGAGAGSASHATDLTFVWHAGTCADALMDIAKDYPDKSVTIVPALVPYGPEWHNKIASEFAIQGDAFDFAMWDSQSTAEFAGGGHAVNINAIFDESDVLSPDLFPAASLSRYGEYPDGSGQFYGLPGFFFWHGLAKRDGVRLEAAAAFAPGGCVAGQYPLFRCIPGDQGAAGHAPDPPGVAVQLDDSVFRYARCLVQAVDVLGDDTGEMPGIMQPGDVQMPGVGPGVL